MSANPNQQNNPRMKTQPIGTVDALTFQGPCAYVAFAIMGAAHLVLIHHPRHNWINMMTAFRMT
jgi:hypothetical protein